ncbi:MAG TPA: NADH-quinone oxidoreductase subunit NuoH [Armatimonadetes bacterium]|nr:NADH-quinone oxidoreductase subunit NuoH [Armatimonadota bacterium]
MSLTQIATFIVSLLHLPRKWVPGVSTFLASLIILGFIMVLVLTLVYLLRKILGWIQVRLGPMITGPQGMLQTPADALKLLLKEDVIPQRADRWVFTLAPAIVFIPAYLVYLVMPFGRGEGLIAKDLNIGILYIAGITSVAVIGIIAAGWASDNKYSLLGAMRSAAQLMTYEIPMILALIGPILVAGTLRLQALVEQQDGGLGNWFLFSLPAPQVLGFLIFLTAALAETNHTPFDLPEAESELVAGYNVEYSGMKFALFFLAEFANIFTASAIAVVLFFGGWTSPFPDAWPVLGWDHGVFSLLWFFLKASAMVFLFMWIRASWPRVRIDQLMSLGWKLLIPLGILNIAFTGGLLALMGG